MLENLKNWIIKNKISAVYDTESATVLEQTANLYGKVQEIITAFNELETLVNSKITSHTGDVYAALECARDKTAETIDNYIKCVDMKLSGQDVIIEDAVKYMKDNLVPTITALFEEMKESGDFGAEFENTVTGLTSRVNSLEIASSSWSNAISSINYTVDDHEQRISAIEGLGISETLDSISTSVSAHELAIAELRNALEDDTGNNLGGDLASEVNKIKSDLSSATAIARKSVTDIVTIIPGYEENFEFLTDESSALVIGNIVHLNLKLRLFGDFSNTLTINNLFTFSNSEYMPFLEQAVINTCGTDFRIRPGVPATLGGKLRGEDDVLLSVSYLKKT